MEKIRPGIAVNLFVGSDKPKTSDKKIQLECIMKSTAKTSENLFTKIKVIRKDEYTQTVNK